MPRYNSLTKTAKAKKNTRLEYRLSHHVHMPKGVDRKAKRKAILDWINQGKFKDRRPTPEELIAECKKKRSPLYGLIDFDVKRAAQSHWRERAQYYLRHIDIVEVEIETGRALCEPVRAYIPIEFNRDRSVDPDNYVPSKRVADSPTMSKLVCDRARAEFEAWMRRWERYDEFLKEFSPVLKAYRELRDKMKKAS